MRKIHLSDLQHRQLQSKSGAEQYSLSAVITESLELNDLFVHHEILKPGHRASAPHFHTHREEMIYVIEGTPTAHLGPNRVRLRPGDFVAFPAGSELDHFVENDSDATTVFLVIANNPKEDQTARAGNEFRS